MSRDRRSSREIRESIEDTRARMDATIDELEQRLSPRQIADQAWSYVREHGHGVGDAVRDHPVPLSLMGLGVAWLAVEEARRNGGNGRTHAGIGSDDRAEGRVGPYRGDAVSDESDHRSIADRARDAASSAKGAAVTAKERAAHAADSARDTASSARQRFGGAAESARSAGGRAREGADQMRRRTGDFAHGIQSFYRDSPLAAGVISFGLGLAAALSSPSTEAEDRIMGDASDAVKTRARHGAEELGQRAAHVAGDTASAAAAEATRQGDGMTGEVKERARKVADEASHAARESAKQQKEDTRRQDDPST